MLLLFGTAGQLIRSRILLFYYYDIPAAATIVLPLAASRTATIGDASRVCLLLRRYVLMLVWSHLPLVIAKASHALALVIARRGRVAR